MDTKILGPVQTKILSRAAVIALGFMFCVFWCAAMTLFIKNNFTTQVGILPPLVSTFLYSCVAAPLWEELAFRHGPLLFARTIAEKAVLPMVLITSAWFGIMHNNGTNSILLQGVVGATFALVYLKNGFNYWSAVILHFIWNFFLIFILPIYK